jgi:GNAT superfamily N-acetyltransferase
MSFLESGSSWPGPRTELDDVQAAEALSDALASDAFYKHVSEPTPPPDRRAALVGYFIAALEEGRAVGVVNAEPQGAAIWSLPTHEAQQEAAAAAATARRIRTRAALGEAGYVRFLSVVDAMAAASSAHASLSEAWYLSILGVAPNLQRRGAGKRLLAPTLAAADAAGAVCWLEAFGEHTLPFYAALGFKPLGKEVIEPNSHAPYWICVREPRQSYPVVCPR